MNELERLKKLVSWIIFSGYAKNESELASKLGYTKSSFSQIMNGRVPVADRFLNKISEIVSNLNIEWIRFGTGDMLNDTDLENRNLNIEIENPINENEKEKMMLRVIESQQRTIEKLTDLVINFKR
jgi:transcriptional regulator with XRE-family HTH domain